LLGRRLLAATSKDRWPHALMALSGILDGADVDLEQAREAARLCIVQGLACLKQVLGSLDRVERILKVTGFVASAPGFNQQPKVIDAASELLVRLFGEAGRHASSAIGVAELPRNAAVEIELIVALR